MKVIRLLIACECSGALRSRFNCIPGIEAISCDLKPAEDGETRRHYQDDVRKILYDGWDGMIAFPDCTYLTSSGLHWNKRRPERARLTEEALVFVNTLWCAPIEQVGLENPIGCLSTRFMKPTQIIQPHQFGEDASKATCLWLRKLPPLQPTKHIEPRIVNGRPRWANQTDSGQNRLGPSETRAAERARTYPGIADAMVAQWAPVFLGMTA